MNEHLENIDESNLDTAIAEDMARNYIKILKETGEGISIEEMISTALHEFEMDEENNEHVSRIFNQLEECFEYIDATLIKEGKEYAKAIKGWLKIHREEV